MRNFFLVGIILCCSYYGQSQNNAQSKQSKPSKASSVVDRIGNGFDKIADAFSGTTPSDEPTPIEVKSYSTQQKSNDQWLNKANYAPWSVGLNLGFPITLFDIPQSGFNYMIGLNAKYSFGHVFGLRADLNTGLFQGAYTGSVVTEKTNKDYDDILTSLVVNTIWNIGTIDFRRRNPNILLYSTVGAGLLFVNARTTKPNADGQYLKYADVAYVVPVGFGCKYKFNDKFDFSFESALNMVENDKLDNYEPFPHSGFSDFYLSCLAGIQYKIPDPKAKSHFDWTNPISVMYSDMDKIAKDNLQELKKDTDGDGVPDILDQELNSKAGYKVDAKGVILDSDNDGIPDTDDADPYGFQEAMKVYFPAETYQKASSVKAYKFNDSIPHDEFIYINDNSSGLPVINFEPNKYDIHVQHYPLMNRIAKIMMLDTNVTLAIIGHADSDKPDMTQITVAEKRAIAVKRKLNKIFEVPEERMLIFSVRDPFVSKYRLKSESLNRKVEFRLVREQK